MPVICALEPCDTWHVMQFRDVLVAVWRYVKIASSSLVAQPWLRYRLWHVTHHVEIWVVKVAEWPFGASFDAPVGAFHGTFRRK